ncbi:MAG: hypothetical protein A2015_17175 [Spirochaetes bacterium GWF1_31_7]|nr:MAG: hypothetical protein A2Y30_14540 [Spirochaetes bacterium GWE1_32_154]OHD50173.1 MAG: hypothetical protein A2Y29_12585 [Spirochaetes bacterium GWE2_31_10]OHD52487.1 MAG: hypothetical protein A2015_17175 [Spirochaetes bacterium GWF1_31_7]OHD81982.1 MAG: hypothetical protein A2355_02085 [Spirochaetes bacterium RIFOXYB1_FULL_32_8]HBD94132.1 exonuclease sbcCD subunit D [Spirochaetia bacterium]
MKFIHTSDLHIGRLLNTTSFLDDQKYILDLILSIIHTKQPDVVLISGDIYDRSVPSAQAVVLFNDFITEIIIKEKIKVVIIPGNHDSNDRLSFGSEILKSNGLHIFTKLEEIYNPVQIEDQYGIVNIYGIPFFQPVFIKSFLDDDPEIKNYNSAYKKLFDTIILPENSRNIVLTHAFISGCTMIDDDEMPLSIGGQEDVDSEVFAQFNYTALGHLHKHQKPSEKVVYSGSPLKYSFNEVNHKKCLIAGEIDGAGRVTIESCELAPQKEMRVIEGAFSEILKNAENDSQKDDYIKVKLTDEGSVFDPANRLRTYYPNLIALEFSRFNITTNNVLKGITKEMKQLGTVEKFCMFYLDVIGKEISEEYKTAFSGVYNEFIGSENK